MNTLQPVDVLAVGPHQDDVEVACGGTIALLRSLGYSVGIADLTAAEMGTRGTPEQRSEEAAEAARLLDVSFRVNLGMPDGMLSHTPEADDAVVRLVRAARPKLLLVPYPEDRHPDHAVAGRMVPEAAFRAGFARLETGQPHHRPLKTLYYMNHWQFEPSFVVDVSDHWKTKLAAIHAYRSQFAVPGASENEEQTFVSSPQFLQRIETRARFYGSQIAAEYGEPYFQHDPVRITNPMSQLASSVEQFSDSAGKYQD